MVDKLEKMAEEYAALNEKFTRAVVDKLNSLVDKVQKNGVTQDISICETYYFAEMQNEYYITRDGLQNYLGSADVGEAAYNMVAYIPTKDLVCYLSKAEEEINKIIGQRLTENLVDSSDFFSDSYEAKMVLDVKLTKLEKHVDEFN